MSTGAPTPAAEHPSGADTLPSPASPPISGWRVSLALGLTALVTGLLVHEVGGLRASGDALRAARWSLTPVALGLMVLILVLCVAKWRVVLDAMGHPLTMREGLYAQLVSLPIAAVTPSRAGDFLRAKVLADKVPTLRALSSVLADRLVDIQTLCLLAVIGAAVTRRWLAAGLIVAGLALAWVLLVQMLRRREQLAQRWPLRRLGSGSGAGLESMLSAFVAMLAAPRRFAAQLAYSALIWCLVLCVIYCLSVMFHAGLTLVEVLALWPLATLVGLVPLTLSGVGTRDAAFVMMVGAFGHAQGAAEAVAAVNANAIVLTTLVYAFISSWMWAVIALPVTWHWMTARRVDKSSPLA